MRDLTGSGPAFERVRTLIAKGYLDDEETAELARDFPEAASEVLGLLRELAAAREWPQFVRYAGLAAHLHPDGLADVIVPVIAEQRPTGDYEDLVEILGELRAAEAVPAVVALLTARYAAEAPYFSLSVKCIYALGTIGTAEANKALRAIATGDWPNPLRWNAAVELRIEDELGFDEDDMLG